MDHIWFTNGATLRMTTTKQYDYLNRLTSISSVGTGSTPSPNSSSYAYNSANQRTALTNADNSFWVYTYDTLGQVTSGRKYWANGTPVAGQQFDYGFDSIGNRQTAASGGNQFGTGLRQQNYSANNLNQYTSRTVPPYMDVLGTSASNATVTVWADKALPILTNDPAGLVRVLRQGDYWRAEVPLNNSTGALWLTITNFAVLNQSTNADILSAVTGSVLVAKSPEAFTYDLDGNLTSDSLWTNTWNGENRRLTVESSAGVSPATARMREQWTFLPDGRWIERIVSTNNGSAYVAAYTNRYVWDGNVLLAVLDHTNGLSLSFTRGLDLNGTPQGAGGAGGLLWVWDRSTINSQPSTHAACYDGNGNVTALVNLSDGTTSAEYAYGPFAEPLQATGPMAKVNPLRFSTQYADDVTGDVNYLFRSYTARTGRWASRDPIDERGGINTVAFLENGPVSRFDPVGLAYGNSIPNVVSLGVVDYFSEGRVFRDPDLFQNFPGFQGTAFWLSDESGERQGTGAYYMQYVHGLYGGICNSGFGGFGTSFVRAKARNQGPCCLRVQASCTAAWVAIKFGGFIPPGLVRPTPAPWVVTGHLLQQPVTKLDSKTTALQSGPITSISIFSKSRVLAQDLKPGEKWDLYELYASVSMQVGGTFGSGFYELMAASCQTKILGSCTSK